VYRPADRKLKELHLPAPAFFTVPSKDGAVTLQGCFYKPSESDWGPGPYPTLVSTYGGPHLQTVQNAWPLTADLRAQHLRACGFLVLKLDNRGSSRRGLVFEAPIKHNMGDLEITDQVSGVEHLVGESLVDPERVGIYGWSYGGYMSAMALMKEPQVFKLAIAGAPVTHWDGYDTHYTERYMGTPASNPEGYAKSAVMPYVEDMQGNLLICHIHIW
jgi:dipeptidyl-peptidase 4